MRELAEISANDADQMDVDEDDVEHVYEYSGLKRTLENMDEMFARIEAQQLRQEELQKKRAASQIKSAASGSGGWKSGFLSGGGAVNNKKGSSNQKVASQAPVVSEQPVNKTLATAVPNLVRTQLTEPSKQEDDVSQEKRRVQFRADNDVHEIDNREQLAQKVKEMKIEERKAELAANRAKEIAEAEAAIKNEEQATGKPRPPPKKPFSGMILEKFP